MSKLRWHLGQLDALRGWAVLGTVAVHAVYTFPVSSLTGIFNTGQRGVQLFFILSWFTLFLSFDNRRQEAHPVRNFYLRRAFRLVPLYYLLLFAVRVFRPDWAGPWYATVLGALFLHGIHPSLFRFGVGGSWTLACEAASYLLLPLLFLRIRSLTSACWLLAGTALGCGLLSFTLGRCFPASAMYFEFLWFPVELPVFAMGIVCYWLWKELGGTSHKAISLLLLSVAGVLLFPALPYSIRTLYGSSLLLCAVLLAVLMHPWPLLVNRATAFLGRISYSIYLLHGYVMHFFVLPLVDRGLRGHLLHDRPFETTLYRFAGTLVLTVPLATLTWWMIEEPGIRLGRRLIARLESKTPRPSDLALIVPAAAVAGEGNSPDAQF